MIIIIIIIIGRERYRRAPCLVCTIDNVGLLNPRLPPLVPLVIAVPLRCARGRILRWNVRRKRNCNPFSSPPVLPNVRSPLPSLRRILIRFHWDWVGRRSPSYSEFVFRSQAPSGPLCVNGVPSTPPPTVAPLFASPQPCLNGWRDSRPRFGSPYGRITQDIRTIRISKIFPMLISKQQTQKHIHPAMIWG
jgi:hypothetical protein